ncbi:hypothetical protein [Streptomyces sp. NBC_00057]|uniref:hypothetical protein n=1 Tax=Streptomyces sp. NBC_00057 TaxID=2975634 RepID=UPI0032538EB6
MSLKKIQQTDTYGGHSVQPSGLGQPQPLTAGDRLRRAAAVLELSDDLHQLTTHDHDLRGASYALDNDE